MLLNDKIGAVKQLNLGYIFFFSGMIIGILINKDMSQSIFSSNFICGYFLWATYLVYKIMYSRFSSILTHQYILKLKISLIIFQIEYF